MHSTKLLLVDAIMSMLRRLCELVFNVHNDAQMKNVFGVNESETKKLIEKMIDALPDQFVFRLSPAEKNEVVDICAREFVFFQVQEKANSTDYQAALKQFIAIFARDIQGRMNPEYAYASNIKER